MPSFRKVSIKGPKFFEEIVLPSFGDLLPDTAVRNGFFGEFNVMDDVVDSRKIIDISRYRNILKRRDASCKIVYDPVGRADVRRISVTELYAATQHCAQEFYQGCLKDWRNGDNVFFPKITEFFKKAIREDMITNMYFGDTEAADAVGTTAWSINKFDGIYKRILQYIAAGIIPSAQTFNIPAGDISAANAKAYFEQMYGLQDEWLAMAGNDEKAFYVDQQWVDAYEDYLIATGATNGLAVNYVQDGIKVRAYKGIPIFVNKIYAPVLRQITGDASPHLGVLTLRGNYIFATDSSYGEGPNLNQALIIWYDEDEFTWKWVNFMKAGTQIGLPEHMVVALPE